jgi:hypothetical protein
MKNNVCLKFEDKKVRNFDYDKNYRFINKR